MTKEQQRNNKLRENNKETGIPLCCFRVRVVSCRFFSLRFFRVIRVIRGYSVLEFIAFTICHKAAGSAIMVY
jgi:hypothetical protein